MSSSKRLQKLNKLQEDLLSPGILGEKLDKITDGVVEIFHADFCRIWITKPGDLCNSNCSHAKIKKGPNKYRFHNQCLHLTSSSGRYTHIDGPHRRMPFGLYKLGCIATGEACKFLTNDVVNDPQVMDQQWARELSLISFAGYKLQNTAGKPIGVLALFSKHPITTEEDTLLEGLAATATQVIQSEKTEEACKGERDRFMDFLESMLDGVYIANKSYEIEYINPVIKKEFGPVKGRKCYDYFNDRIEICPWCKNPEVFAGKAVRWEWYSKKNNKTYDLLDQPLQNYDGSFSKIEIFRDITKHKQTEEELKVKNKQIEEQFIELSHIYNTSPVGLSYIDTDIRFRRINQILADINGISIEEHIGKTLREVLPEHASTLQPKIRKVIKTGEHLCFEVHGTTPAKPNEERDWRVDYYPVKSFDGSIQGVTSVWQDITNQKQTELETRFARDKLKNILNSMEDGVYIINQQNSIEYVNPVVEKEFGPTQGRKCYEHFYYREKACPWCINPDVYAGRTARSEHYFHKTNKTYDLIATPIKNSDGSISKLMIFRDITHLKKTEEALKKSEKKYRNLVDNAIAGVFKINLKGDLLYANEAMVKMFEFNFQTEMTAAGVIPRYKNPEDRKILIEKLLKAGKVDNLEFDLLTKRGKEKNVIISAFLEGDIISGMVIDISDRKQMEKKLEKLAKKDSLTEAYNRSQLNEFIGREMERTSRFNLKLSMIMFDVDNFKQINDTHGHIVGDQVLKKIGCIVRENIRKINYFIRWGGEEFIIITPETDLNKAKAMSERIRKVVESHKFDHAGKVTVSFGVTRLKKEDTIDTFIKRVDDAMYLAKRNGKNRVEVN